MNARHVDSSLQSKVLKHFYHKIEFKIWISYECFWCDIPAAKSCPVSQAWLSQVFAVSHIAMIDLFWSLAHDKYIDCAMNWTYTLCSLTGILKHNQRHHPKVTFPCSQCPKRFGVKSDLIRHLGTHKEESQDLVSNGKDVSCLLAVNFLLLPPFLMRCSWSLKHCTCVNHVSEY